MEKILFIFLFALVSMGAQAQTIRHITETDLETKLNDTLDAVAPLQLVGYGTSTVGGTSKVVSDAKVQTGYLIIAWPNGALVNAGTLSVSDVTTGQFTIRSTNFLDSRQFTYLIIKEE